MINIGSLFGSRSADRDSNIERVRDTTEYHDPSFRDYSKQLFKRLDTITDRLTSLREPEPEIFQQALPPPGSPELDDSQDDSHFNQPNVLALIAGAVAQAGPEFFASSVGMNMRRAIATRARARALRTARAAESRARFNRSALGRAANSVRAEASRVARGGARMIGRLGGGRVGQIGQALRTRIASGAGGIVNRIGNLGRFFRLLSPLARRIPLIATLLVPLMESIEANHDIQELTRQLDAGEITQDQFNELATEHVIQAALNTVGTLGGGLLGGLLGVGVGSILTGAAGAWAGNALANWLGPQLARPLARAINSNSNIPELVRELADMLTGRIPLRQILHGIPGISEDNINALVGAYQSAQGFARDAERVGQSIGTGWNNLQRSASNFFGGLQEQHAPESHANIQPGPSQQVAIQPAPQTPTILHQAPAGAETPIQPVVLVNAPRRTVVNTRLVQHQGKIAAHTPNLGAVYA